MKNHLLMCVLALGISSTLINGAQAKGKIHRVWLGGYGGVGLSSGNTLPMYGGTLGLRLGNHFNLG